MVQVGANEFEESRIRAHEMKTQNVYRKGEQAINEAESKYKVTYCTDMFQPLLVKLAVVR